MALGKHLTIPCAIALALSLSVTAEAQSAAAHQSWFVSASGWGKWVSLGVAAGLTTFGAIRSNDASDRFQTLETQCRTDSSFCRLDSQGIYVEPEAERLFQQTLSLDSEAQKFLIGGQVTLVLSGAMFLVDLLSDDGGPEDIPFTPLRVYSTPNKIGLSLPF